MILMMMAPSTTRSSRDGWCGGGGSQTLHQSNQFLVVDRLGQVAIHAGRQALLTVALHGMGGHGDDRRPLSLAFSGTDHPGRFQTVQVRHLHVHQHHIEVLLTDHFECLKAVLSDFDAVAALTQNVNGHLLVRRIVFRQQDSQATSGLLRKYVLPRHRHRSSAGTYSQALGNDAEQFALHNRFFQVSGNSQLPSALMDDLTVHGGQHQDHCPNELGVILDLPYQGKP